MLRFALVLAALFVSPPALSARTWHINPDGTGDAPTIQAGMDSTAAGDTVEVAPGTYFESDISVARPVTVRSVTGTLGSVTIDAGGAGRHFDVNELPFHMEGLRLVGGKVPQSAPNLVGGSIRFSTGGTVTLVNSEFRGNYAPGSGGAIYLAPDTDLRLTDCQFIENVAEKIPALGGNAEGGAIASQQGTIDALRCTFLRNSAVHRGFGGAVHSMWANDVFVDCLFEENIAGPSPYSLHGGAVRALYGSIVFEDCVFLRNTTTGTGGGFSGYSVDASFARCSFVENETTSHSGGAVMAVFGSSASFESCTITNTKGGSGGAVFVAPGPLTLNHTIIAFSQGAAVATVVGLDPDVSCSCVYGNEAGDWVGPLEGLASLNGNFSADPLFCDPEAGDYTIRSNSPCAPPGVTGCGLIGALPVGCGPVSVEAMSWGQIKRAYR